ncbi:MAG: PH domain-containing protein [Deltaproteobacteria bacterium]|nr:PH domain-containing protein [Deltaproteobacteria bacterium]
MQQATVYPMSSGAKMAYTVVGVLLCILILTIPVGIYFIIRARGGRVEVTGEGITARGIGTTTIGWADTTRLGVLEVRVVARGIGGWLARKKTGGPTAYHLCACDRSGKTRYFMASSYDGWQNLIQQAAATRQLPLETMSMGWKGPKWPDTAAA